MEKMEQRPSIEKQANNTFQNVFESSEFKIKLDKAISDFSTSHRNLSETNNAKWQCIEVSWEFIKFLNDSAVISPEMIELGFVGVFHTSINGIPHTEAKVGNGLIDWTYRQFDPESPFPYIHSL